MILPYTFVTMESPRITVVGAFGLKDVNFLTVTWDWTLLLFLVWPAERLIESSCSLHWFSLPSISLSSIILKRLRDAKLLRSLLPDDLSFAIFFGVTNFLVWLLSLTLLYWKYLSLYFEFSIISLMILGISLFPQPRIYIWLSWKNKIKV